MKWRDKFFEILERHGLSVGADFRPMNVVMNVGDSRFFRIWGNGEPIPPEIKNEFIQELFPLIASQVPGSTVEICERVLAPGDHYKMKEGWDEHCWLMNHLPGSD